MAALKKWYDALEDILICPVCLAVPESKIFQCSNGHICCLFCKAKVPACPVCQGAFITTRNFIAENVIECTNIMKVHIDNELKSMTEKVLNICAEEQKIKCPDKDVKTVSSQTNCSMYPRVVSNFTQTDNVTLTSFTEINKGPRKQSAILYPCLIGSCLLQLSYMDLIKHLTMCHKDTFYEVEQSDGIFTEKCIIETDILPTRMDFTFHINNMGLFFFNIIIDDDGLAATVKVADHVVTSQFEYQVKIATKKRMLTKHNLVTSSRFNKKPSTCKFGKEIFPMIGSIECTLTIQRCKQRCTEADES